MNNTSTYNFTIKELKDYESFLKLCYASDDELINLYHVESGKGLDACLQKTLSDFDKASDFRFNIVNDGDEVVGYFGEETFDVYKALCGFFIFPKYRNQQGRKLFMDTIKERLDSDFYAGVGAKNFKAVNFLFNGGGKIEYTVVQEQQLFYLFKFNKSCL